MHIFVYMLLILNINKKGSYEFSKSCIPIYQASLSQQERKSLLQVYKILQMHPLVVIKPTI